MVGILFPDNHETELRNFHGSFVRTLLPDEFENGEPKGSLFHDQTRKRLFEFIKDHDWLRIAPTLSDSQFNNESEVQGYRMAQVSIYGSQIRESIGLPVDPALSALRSRLLDDMRDGLSDVQVVKGLMLMYTLEALLRNSVNAFEGSIYDPSWGTFDLVFDRQDRLIITRMEEWVNNAFLNFLSERGRTNPLILPASWRDRPHPFVQQFGDGANPRLVLNNVFAQRFQFQDSAVSFGLQMVDWISNTLYGVIRRRRCGSYLDMIGENLVGHGRASISLAAVYHAKTFRLYLKYADLIYNPKTKSIRLFVIVVRFLRYVVNRFSRWVRSVGS